MDTNPNGDDAFEYFSWRPGQPNYAPPPTGYIAECHRRIDIFTENSWGWTPKCPIQATSAMGKKQVKQADHELGKEPLMMLDKFFRHSEVYYSDPRMSTAKAFDNRTAVTLHVIFAFSERITSIPVQDGYLYYVLLGMISRFLGHGMIWNIILVASLNHHRFLGLQNIDMMSDIRTQPSVYRALRMLQDRSVGNLSWNDLLWRVSESPFDLDAYTLGITFADIHELLRIIKSSLPEQTSFLIPPTTITLLPPKGTDFDCKVVYEVVCDDFEPIYLADMFVHLMCNPELFDQACEWEKNGRIRRVYANDFMTAERRTMGIKGSRDLETIKARFSGATALD